MDGWTDGRKQGRKGRRQEKRRLYLALSFGIILNSTKIACVL